jgi:FkbM family methyltransferase
MNLGNVGATIERALSQYRGWRLRRIPGALGDFYRAGGNALLFRDLPVSSSDVVVDVGGYRGDWTAEMSWRYGSRAIVLEPIPTHATEIQGRFARNDRVYVIAAGLGPRDGTLEMALAGDSSSSVRESRSAPHIQVSMIGVARLFNEQRLDEVACLKLNIEGAEYDLLDAMADGGLLPRVRSLVVQFHDIGPSTEARVRRTRELLAKTHQPRFAYELVWERWDRTSPGPA